MVLGPGTRLRSAVSSTEVIVVRPSPAAVAVACGGEPMLVLDAAAPPSSPNPTTADSVTGTTELGKRYEDADTGLELLCTKGGPGALSVDGRELGLKAAKPLPASD